MKKVVTLLWALLAAPASAAPPASPDTFDPENHKNWDLLDHETCGLAMADRIIGGHKAALGQYPWIVQLGSFVLLNGSQENFYFCGGALISPLYVVSAAHCKPSDEKGEVVLSVIKAGEHDVKTNPDCVDEDCAPPVQKRGVARAIRHADYNNPYTQNDMLLVKADAPFDFNGFVNAVCLPPNAMIGETFQGETAEVAGWGVYNLNFKIQSSVLLTVTLPVMTNKDCFPLFAKYLNLSDNQMCVGGDIGKDSCSGDSGGPLMKAVSVGDRPPRTFIVGVVSLGFSRCGATKNPGIYSRMTFFEKWVLDHIEE